MITSTRLNVIKVHRLKFIRSVKIAAFKLYYPLGMKMTSLTYLNDIVCEVRCQTYFV